MSKLPFELFLALRYLRPKRTFVSIITLISIIGVALGVAVLIIVISVMSGFDHDLRAKILGFNSHLKIFATDQNGRTETMENYEDVMRIVSSNKNVTVSRRLFSARCCVETQPANGRSGPSSPRRIFAASTVNTENSVSMLPKSIVAGSLI